MMDPDKKFDLLLSRCLCSAWRRLGLRVCENGGPKLSNVGMEPIGS